MSMSFLAIAPFLLYAATSQAAPMVNTTTSMKPTTEAVVPNQESFPPSPLQPHLGAMKSPPPSPPSSSSPLPPHLSHQPLLLQPHSLSQPPSPPRSFLPPQPQYYSQPQHYPPPQPQHLLPQLPQRCTPCPPDCQQQQPIPVPPSQQPPQKKTGWHNGVAKPFKYCYNAFYETFVGERGILTNLSYKADGSRSKKSKKDSISGNENAQARCIFYKNPPPVQDEDDETEDPPTIQLPPISCNWIKNRINSNPTVEAAASMVPNTTNRSKSTQFSCCFVGSKVFYLQKLFKAHIKPQFNCCAGTVNINLVEM